MIAFGVTAVAVGRWNLASLCVVLACLVKAYPVSLALLLILLYPRRFAGRFLLLLAVFAVLPFLCQAPGYVCCQYHDWVRWGLNDRQPEELAVEIVNAAPMKFIFRKMRAQECFVILPRHETNFLAVSLIRDL